MEDRRLQSPHYSGRFVERCTEGHALRRPRQERQRRSGQPLAFPRADAVTEIDKETPPFNPHTALICTMTTAAVAYECVDILSLAAGLATLLEMIVFNL